MKFFSSKSKDKKVKKKSNTIIDRIILPIFNNHLRTPKERLHGRIEKDGAIIWYKDGILHHLEEPAILWDDGSYQWYHNGLIHRNNAPAAESHGNKYWYQHGKRHRLDGPAVEFENGMKEWWIDGNQLEENDFIYEIEKLKNKKD